MAVRGKTIAVSLLVLLVLVVLGGLTAVGWQVVLGPDARAVTAEPFEVTEARLARGQYLTEGPMHCFFCHTEHDLSVPEYPMAEGKKGAGWVMPIPELNNIAARNITPDKETGLGDWSDDEIARAIREGVRKDGSALFPVMPYPDFATLDDEDVKSIVVYLRTIPAVRNVVPTRSLPGPLEYLVNTMPVPVTTPLPSHPRSTPVERGQYLAKMAGCAGCHTPVNGEGMPLPGLDFAGGQPFQLPDTQNTTVFTVNITSDPSGIAHYDDAMFRETVRTGQIPGRMLNHVMPFSAYRHMTDDDLNDIFAFIRSVPPIKHRVSNTDPPTFCPICEQTHGLGELNVKATGGN